MRPELVAQIAFTEWTTDGKLRHPRFEGLRLDKAPYEVIRERPTGSPRGGSGGRQQLGTRARDGDTPGGGMAAPASAKYW